MTGIGVPSPHLFVGQELLGFGRCESLVASHYRMAVYPDGRHVLQGGFHWTEGLRHGVTWRDMPLAPTMVDAAGVALEVQVSNA